MARRRRVGSPLLLTVVIALGTLVAVAGAADAATPIYLSTGTARNNNTATLPTTMPPTWAAGNLLLLDVFHAGPEATTLPTPSGWTPVPGSPAKSSYGQQWRFVLASAPAATSAPTLSFSSANVVIANISSFQDAAGVGASASAADGASNTTPIRQPTVTVNAGELLVVGDAERVAAPPNPTVQPDPSYTEQVEVSSTQANGSGGTLELAVKPVGASGPNGGETFTPSLPARDALIATTLTPTGTAPSTAPHHVSTGVARDNNTASLLAVMPPGWTPGDLLMLDVFHAGPSTTTLTADLAADGWAAAPGSPVKADYGQLWRYTKPAVAATSPPTLTFSQANAVIALMHDIRDAGPVGTGASTFDSAIDTDGVTTPSVTVPDQAVLFTADAERVAAPPNPGVSPDADYTERFETSTTQAGGSGGTLELAERGPLAAGTYTGDVFTPTSAARDALIVTAVLPASSPSPTTTTNPPPTGLCGFKTGGAVTKALVIWMENKDYDQIVGSSSAPFENGTVKVQCATASNYSDLGHPSLPNYMSATSGVGYNFAPWSNDCSPGGTCATSNPSIYSQMEAAAGKSWKGYAESMPANCYPSDSGTYVPRHNPPPYYSNLTQCGTNDLPMGTTTSGNLVDDVQAGTLPTYSHVTPNNCSNTHDCSILTGDNWLASIIPMIASGPDYQQGRLAIFLMWDEGFSTDHPPAFILSAYTNPGLVSTEAFNPYSLLRTTEEIAGVPLLGDAASASSMRAAFQLG